MTGALQTPRLLTPGAALDALTAALAAADLDLAAACFAREARLLTPDGTTVAGRRHIAAVLDQLIACQTELDLGQPVLVCSADVALASGQCTMRSKGPDLFWITQKSELTAVLRLIEGDWKLAIFAPWGRDHTYQQEDR